MEGYKALQSLVSTLIQSQQITIFQGQNFLRDLKNPNEQQQLFRKTFQLPQVNQFLLKHFITNKYDKQIRTSRKGLTHPQMRKEAYQQQEPTKEENSQLQDSLSYVALDIAQNIKDEANQLQALVDFTKYTISDLLLYKDQHKIRSKHQQLLKDYFGISQIKLIVFREDFKLHTFNSKINYMSEIYETHPKYDQIIQFCQILNQNSLFIASQNSSFCQLFGSTKGIGIIRGQEAQKYLMILQMDKYSPSSFNDLKKQNNFNELFYQFAWKIIEISMSTTYELIRESIFNYYAKNWTQLLQLTIRMNYQANFLNTKSQYERQFEVKFQDVSNFGHFVKALEKSERDCKNEQNQKKKNQILISQIHKLQELQCFQLQNLRLYRKMMDTKEVIFMDFNQSGKLTFLSCNFRHEVISKLKKLWKIKSVQITDIFYKDKQLQKLIKKGSQGQISQGKFYELDDLKAKIFLSEQKYIQRIQILIQQQIENQYSSESKSSSTNIFSDNLEDSTQLSAKSNDKILKKIQKMDPSTKNEGWISLFLKGQPNKNQLPFPINKNSIKGVGKRAKSEDNMNYIISSQKSLDSITKNCLKIQKMDIQKIDIDLLTIGQENLKPFVIKVFCKLSYFKEMSQQKTLLGSFLRQLHQNYEIHNNPFHNFIHGVNVMHTSYLISSIPKNKQVFSNLKIFSIVFSALCHDVGHTGFTNSFQIASRSQKALTYNDISPLQNFHASRTFQILRKPTNNFMCLRSRQEFNEFRKDVVSNILYTDIKEHFPLLKKFDDRRAQNNLLTPDDATLLSAIIVHASDFGGSVKEFQVSKMWSQRVNKQFTNQYEQQGKLGLTQTPFMKDLTNPLVLAKNQTGFLQVIVNPLYKALNEFYVDDYKIKTLYSQVEQNLRVWIDKKKILEEQIKQKQQKLQLQSQKQ